MQTLQKLNAIEKRLTEAQRLLASVIASEPKPKPGKPPMPTFQSVEYYIWLSWDKLKAENEFTAYHAKEIVKADGKSRLRTDSSYSAVLSRWARDGYIKLITQGSGQKPSTYKI